MENISINHDTSDNNKNNNINNGSSDEISSIQLSNFMDGKISVIFDLILTLFNELSYGNVMKRVKVDFVSIFKQVLVLNLNLNGMLSGCLLYSLVQDNKSDHMIMNDTEVNEFFSILLKSFDFDILNKRNSEQSFSAINYSEFVVLMITKLIEICPDVVIYRDINQSHLGNILHQLYTNRIYDANIELELSKIIVNCNKVVLYEVI